MALVVVSEEEVTEGALEEEGMMIVDHIEVMIKVTEVE